MSSEKCKHPACLSIQQLCTDCDFSRTKSGGPGGQHRNKVETTVIVTHRSTKVVARAGERRSQHENKKVAIERLRETLAVEIRSQDQRTSPTELWINRCIGGKISCSSNHDDFACLLAEALDWIVQSSFQISDAAKSLNCSTSQLIKFIKQSDLAFSYVNSIRKTLDLGPLK